MAHYDAERQAWMQDTHTGWLGDFFEEIINAIYSAILKPGDLAVDCGAHSGLHTFPMSKLVGLSGRVVAVEAIPDVAAGLRSGPLQISMSKLPPSAPPAAAPAFPW